MNVLVRKNAFFRPILTYLIENKDKIPIFSCRTVVSFRWHDTAREALMHVMHAAQCFDFAVAAVAVQAVC